MTASEHPTGAAAILEFARARGIDYLFCSPIAVLAPLWEALAARASAANRRPRATATVGTSCWSVSLASGYAKVTGRPQLVSLPTGLGVLNGAIGLRSALQERRRWWWWLPDSLSSSAPIRRSIRARVAVAAGRSRRAGARRRGGGEDGRARCARRPSCCPSCAAPSTWPRRCRAADVAAGAVRGPDAAGAGARRDADRGGAGGRRGGPARRRGGAAVAAARPLIVTEHGGRHAGGAAALVRLAETLVGAGVRVRDAPACENVPRRHPLFAHGPVEPALADATSSWWPAATRPGVAKRRPSCERMPASSSSRRIRCARGRRCGLPHRRRGGGRRRRQPGQPWPSGWRRACRRAPLARAGSRSSSDNAERLRQLEASAAAAGGGVARRRRCSPPCARRCRPARRWSTRSSRRCRTPAHRFRRPAVPPRARLGAAPSVPASARRSR